MRRIAYGTANGHHHGTINEGDETHGGGLRTNKRHPFSGGRHARTEDLNHTTHFDVAKTRDDLFQPGNGARGSDRTGNIRLDSEDLDRNGTLDCGNPGPAATLGMSSRLSFTVGGLPVEHGGLLRVPLYPFVPLNISSSTRRQLDDHHGNAHLLKAGGVRGGKKVRFKNRQIAVVGINGWPRPVPLQGSTVTVLHSNETDPSYVSPLREC